jgi:hypothetical protein
MKFISSILALCMIALFVGCTKDDSVSIRVKNVSSYDFAGIEINDIKYDSLPSNQTSDYKFFKNGAYSSGHIVVYIGSDTIQSFLIDVMGMEPLEHGNYTYELDIFVYGPDTLLIQQECVADQK